jgi:hypothetical protein
MRAVFADLFANIRYISKFDRTHGSGESRLGIHAHQGALVQSRPQGGRGTIANVLKRNGVEPLPERSRRTSWSSLLKAHWKVLAAGDFLTVEVWTANGLVTHYLLFAPFAEKRAASSSSAPGRAAPGLTFVEPP